MDQDKSGLARSIPSKDHIPALSTFRRSLPPHIETRLQPLLSRFLGVFRAIQTLVDQDPSQKFPLLVITLLSWNQQSSRRCCESGLQCLSQIDTSRAVLRGLTLVERRRR